MPTKTAWCHPGHFGVCNARNPWTQAALMNDYHLGDFREARMIADENGEDDPETCGVCGRESGWFRRSVGANQCYYCRAIHHRYVRDGRSMDYWK